MNCLDLTWILNIITAVVSNCASNTAKRSCQIKISGPYKRTR